MITYLWEWGTLRFFQAYGLFRMDYNEDGETIRHSLYERQEIPWIDANGKIDLETGSYYLNKETYNG